MLRRVSDVQNRLSGWMTRMNRICLSYRSSTGQAPNLATKGLWLLGALLVHRSRRLFAIAGALDSARGILARIRVNTAFVASVVDNTAPETSVRASLAAKKALALVEQKAVALVVTAPQTFTKSLLKRKAVALLDASRFRRGFVWTNYSFDCVSSAALSTETAVPLPSPPAHLLENPHIQSSRAMKAYIKVNTPFNADRLEALLHDHPNQPFVASFMKCLREGFWPFESEWKFEEKTFVENFASEEEDPATICTFRDKELAACR